MFKLKKHSYSKTNIVYIYDITAVMSGARYIVRKGRIPWPKTDTTHYHTQLGFPDNGRSCRAFDREILHFINKIWFKDTSKLELIREKGNTTFLLKRISDLLSQSVREADTTHIKLT